MKGRNPLLGAALSLLAAQESERIAREQLHAELSHLLITEGSFGEAGARIGFSPLLLSSLLSPDVGRTEYLSGVRELAQALLRKEKGT